MADNEIIKLEQLSLNDDTNELTNGLNITIKNVDTLDTDFKDLVSSIGLPLSRLKTIEKTSIIDAINSFLSGGDVDAFTLIGDAELLTTGEKNNLVIAINWLHALVASNQATVDQVADQLDSVFAAAASAEEIARQALASARGTIEGSTSTEKYLVIPAPFGNGASVLPGTNVGQIQIIVPGFLTNKRFKFDIEIITGGTVNLYTVSGSVTQGSVLTGFDYVQTLGTYRPVQVVYGKSGSSAIIGIGTLSSSWTDVYVRVKDVTVITPLSDPPIADQWASLGWNIAIRGTSIPNIQIVMSGKYLAQFAEVSGLIEATQSSAINSSYKSLVALAIALG